MQNFPKSLALFLLFSTLNPLFLPSLSFATNPLEGIYQLAESSSLTQTCFDPKHFSTLSNYEPIAFNFLNPDYNDVTLTNAEPLAFNFRNPDEEDSNEEIALSSDFEQYQSNTGLKGSEQCKNGQRIPTDLGQICLEEETSLEANGIPLHLLLKNVWQVAANLIEKNYPANLKSELKNWNLRVVSSVDGMIATQADSRFCHLAYISSPANIVIDANAVLHPCQDTQDSDITSNLSSSLIHEIGHIVEFRLLGEAFPRRQRWHSEGFAMFFESSGQAGLRAKGYQTKFSTAEFSELASANTNSNWSPYYFNASASDYAKSFLLVDYLIKTKSLDGLIKIYQKMARENLSFEDSAEGELELGLTDWTKKALSSTVSTNAQDL